MVNSRQKGKRGELEAVHWLNDRGFNTRRGQQYCGIEGDADIVGIDGLHIEVKRVERLNIHEAVKQAVRDARDGETGIVMHRKDRTEWLVTLRAEDYFNGI